MMSSPDQGSSGRKGKPGSDLDAELQRELDEALGGMSVEDLMDSEQAGSSTATKGVRRGRVVAIHKEDIFVEMGGKSQGILPASQFHEQPLPNVGDMIEVTIEGYDANEGLLMLSREGAVQAAAWETLQEGQLVEGRVTGFNKGGLEVSINGIHAFMPISQIELFRVEDLSPYVNQRMQCTVTEVDPAEQRVILSRRNLLELEAQEKREQAWTTLSEGKVVVGKVKTIMPYGAFVDIGGVDGLLHVRDMAHGRVEDPKTIVSEGQQIEVMILKVDREARRIGLGLKQTLADPWKDADAKWTEESIVSGRITRLAEFGAFVELEEGVEGLIPIGEMTFERRIHHPSEIVKEGDIVKVRVLAVDMARKRISLSLKRAGDDPWTGASSRWPVNSLVTGVVKRLTDFGAFIELTPGVEGMAHISELSDGHVKSVSDAVQEGQSVQAKVISVDEDRRRIALSIKQAFTSAEYTGGPAAEAAADQPAAPARKRTKPLKGGLD
ncbi:MAG: S1 RNA-binding domain-containing protein [Phycisphaerae bacterium]|jgi:small subunit ribosomal protein S1